MKVGKFLGTGKLYIVVVVRIMLPLVKLGHDPEQGLAGVSLTLAWWLGCWSGGEEGSELVEPHSRGRKLGKSRAWLGSGGSRAWG